MFWQLINITTQCNLNWTFGSLGDYIWNLFKCLTDVPAPKVLLSNPRISFCFLSFILTSLKIRAINIFDEICRISDTWRVVFWNLKSIMCLIRYLCSVLRLPITIDNIQGSVIFFWQNWQSLPNRFKWMRRRIGWISYILILYTYRNKK